MSQHHHFHVTERVSSAAAAKRIKVPRGNREQIERAQKAAAALIGGLEGAEYDVTLSGSIGGDFPPADYIAVNVAVAPVLDTNETNGEPPE